MNTTPSKRVSPAEFFRQVRQEVSKVTWPSRKETFISAAMVLVMVVIASLFFLVVDGVISSIVTFILS